MSPRTFLSTFRALVDTPTAPFREHWVCEVLDRLLAGIPGLQTEIDRFGNRIVRLRRGNPVGEAVTFVAHLDHPGFLFPAGFAEKPREGNRYEAVFEGRVQDAYFANGRVRLFRSPEDPGVAGRLVRHSEEIREAGNRSITIEAEGDADGAMLAMWDLPPLEVRDGLIHARVCDDLAGVAAIVSAFRQLAETPGDVDVAAIFSRAEEAGFCGVMCLLSEPKLPALLPRETIFISVENSSELPGVRVGEGAIIRIGDRSSTFDGRLADLLWSLARHRGINARRMLMDRGTCEATPFARHGLRAGGICIPLRNYHNMNAETGLIDAECIALDDAEALVDLIAALAQASSSGESVPPPVQMEYELFLRKGLNGLKDAPLVRTLT